MGTQPAFEKKPGSDIPDVGDASGSSARSGGTEPNVVKPRSATRIASGAVPPANAQTEPESLQRDRIAVAATQHFQPKRRTGVGTMMHGAEGLQDPGVEKVRLTAGKVVPGTRYKIIRWVGEGGMGVVYEAEHVDIERRVALKILRFDLSQQPRMVQVFKDEAKAAGKLGSQHVVEIYDFGELSDGRLFFAMELLDGTDLVAEEDGDVLSPADTIGILRQVCKGLLVAHRQDVVHRDVKPDNIITTSASDGHREIVKVVDFGISAMLAAGSDSGGGIAGTPHYMAPEQVLGTDFDGRLDIYALGCTAFEMLTGAPPFDSDAIEELLAKQIHEPPPRVTDVRSDVPVALSDVIDKCLAKQPGERYPDMAELEAALCEAQIASGLVTRWDDLPLPDIADVDRKERIRQKMPSLDPLPERRGLLWPIVAGASTLLAVGLGLFLVFGRGPTNEDKVLVDGIANEARTAASRLEWFPVAHSKIEELEGLEGSAENLGDERGSQLRDEFASTLRGQGDRLWDQGNHKLAFDYYVNSLAFDKNQPELYERIDMHPGALADYLRRLKAGELTERERYIANLAKMEMVEDPEQKAELEQALLEADVAEDELLILAEGTSVEGRVRRKKRVVNDSEAVAEAQPDLSDLEEALEEAQLPEDEVIVETPAEQEERKAKKKRTRRPKSTDPDAGVYIGKAERDPQRASQLADEGMTALRAGRRAEAAKLFNQAISFDNRNAKALMGLSDIYFDTGKDTQAIVYAERAVKASPGNKSYRIKLGDAYFKALRYKDALSQYQEAKKRGSKKADGRIARAKAKTG